MGHKRSSGLIKRGDVWHFDKVFRGQRIRGSAQTGDLDKAEELLTKLINDIRDAQLLGKRPDRTFRQAATKFLNENQHKKSLGDDAGNLKALDPFIGDTNLRMIHMDTLRPFIEKRQADGVKTSTINLALAVVRHILNLAAEWRDENGLTWIEHAPKIRLLRVKDARKAYPLSRDQEAVLLAELPDHLAAMTRFKANTGCREEEVCGLKWTDEIEVPELGTSVFKIAGDNVKNKEDRVVVLNRVARAVIEAQRGLHPVYVFTYARPRRNKPPTRHRVTRMNGSAWRKARVRAAARWARETAKEAPAGFQRVRVHDIKHTFGKKLRAAGVSFEDRQDLLGHKSGQITTHYSAPELANLIAAAEKVCALQSHNSPTLTVVAQPGGLQQAA